MAVSYGFFDSVGGDRKYSAAEMSQFYDSVITEGVFQNFKGGLAVSAGTGLSVSVAAGRANVQSRWLLNDAALTLSIDAASTTYGRIDAVVMRLSESSRNISIVVKKGTPASSPVAPSLTRSGGTYEMALAYVTVAANASSVSVTDKRSDSSLCGWAAVRQSVPGEIDAMLEAMKTGFDGVTYSSPAAMVTSEDQFLMNVMTGQDHTFDVTVGTKTLSIKIVPNVLYEFTNGTTSGCTINLLKLDGSLIPVASGVVAGTKYQFSTTETDIIGIKSYVGSVGTIRIRSMNALINNKFLQGVEDFTSICSWEIGSIYSSTGQNYNISYGIRTPDNARILVNNDSVIYSYNSNIGSVYAFKYDLSGTFIERIGIDENKNAIIPGGYKYRFLLLAKSTSTIITQETMPLYYSDFYATGKTLGNLLIANSESNAVAGYCIGSDLIKRKISANRIGNGTLKYGQSFLIYNNKFYSTDGEHIAVQNMNFTVENDVALSLGHGNAFMLGADNKGYVSGWDDSKIYVVDLDSIEIISEIDIPYEGYTTCAVDTVNGIAFVFQRETTPTTESIYNLIVYDYVNETEIVRNQTSISFAAMQSCDLFHDKIIVLNGLGTNSAPNGYRIFNRSGEILADYYFDDFATIEPEGVFIDRTNGDMYISLVNAKVYKITP